MPILNHDILHEILIESTKKQNFRPLANFMMAGKETFNIALNHFSKAKSAKVEAGKIIVDVRSSHGTIKDVKVVGTFIIDLTNSPDKVIRYKISYDFPLLKPLLGAIGSSLEELTIQSDSPKAQKCKVLDYLLKNDLKKVSLFTKLPKLCNSFLRQSQVEKFCISSPERLSDRAMIPKSCNHLEICDTTMDMFWSGIQQKKKGLPKCLKKPLFPYVKELIIDARIHSTKLMIEELEEFVTAVSRNFPVLETFTVKLNLFDDGWNSISDVIHDLKPSLFKDLRDDVKGIFMIVANDIDEFFEDIRDELRNEPNLVVNTDQKQIIKNFKIRDELMFVASFFVNGDDEVLGEDDEDGGEEEDNDSVEDGEDDEDDIEIGEEANENEENGNEARINVNIYIDHWVMVALGAYFFLHWYIS